MTCFPSERRTSNNTCASDMTTDKTQKSYQLTALSPTMTFTMMLSSAAARSSAAVARRPAFLASLIPRNNFSDEAKKPIRKVKKKEKKTKGESGRARDLEVILAALDAPPTMPPTPDEDEKARREQILKNYTVGKFKQHNAENHDLNCKIRMKQHAMNMLPKDSKLKEKAMEIDDEKPPRWRHIPAWTPPIPNFNPKDFIGTEE